MATTAVFPSLAGDRPQDRAIAAWLLLCAAMIFAMAVIGAITRLTESGLSIMEWAPLSGALPPLSEAEWQRLFALYKTIPEYQQINRGMSLAAFKEIFWWEYIHRLWGRLIGLVFALPFLWFLLTGRIRRGLTPHLAAMLALGGLQGLLGWYMVASGFAERTDVSQYRLVAHLGLAAAIYAYVLWIALGLLAPQENAGPRRLQTALIAFAVLLAVTVASGGFVAGLNAGLIYNTVPLMDGHLVPAGYGRLDPWPLNLFENVAAVQFNHRLLAVVTVLAAFALWFWARRLALSERQGRAMAALAIAAALQLGLGVATLLLLVPVWLGALHQAGAFLLLSLTVWALRSLRPMASRP